MTSRAKISIIGGGAVGKAVAGYYNPDVKIYDKYHALNSIEEAVVAADYIFVAVPTPFKNGQDLTEMDDAVARVVAHLGNPGKQVIIIKSTVLPGVTEGYQEKYPQANFVFNPEFLTEKTAVSDFANPDKQLVGYTSKTKDLAAEVMAILPDAPYKKMLPAEVCEMVKYAINAYYAYKVIFGNQIYDLCQKFGIDYDLVRQGLVADSRIADSHFDVFYGGYRGYAGKCLPKDVETLAWLARKKAVDVGFIETIIAINNKLRAQKDV